METRKKYEKKKIKTERKIAVLGYLGKLFRAFIVNKFLDLYRV